MRRRVLVASLATLISLVAPTAARAQSVKGVVVDDSSKLAIEGVLIALVDSRGEEQPRTVRSDSSGSFILHASRPGTYRVRATRIGYRPVHSDPVPLPIGQLAVVRLRMVSLAQQLIAVRVIERRPMNAAELMSTTGFDLRESKGLGTFLSGEALASLGHASVRDIMLTHLQPTAHVLNDPVLGEVLRIRQGRTDCAPEIYLDGQLLATIADQPAILDGSNLTTEMDSLRFRMSVESDQSRTAASQIYAMSVLTNLRAVDLHGIEVYRGNQLPPPSLGAWFGSTKASVRPCGTIAVWTKNGGGRPVVTARSRTVDALQVISGTVLDLDSQRPVPGVRLTLLNDARETVTEPVISDERGEFVIRTNRAGALRLRAGSIGFTESTSPAFPVAADELVFVRMFVSATQAVLAPLGVTARVLPRTFGISELGGFTYRRERGLHGVFFRPEEIRASGARSLAELVKGVAGVQVTGTASGDAIEIVPAEDLPRCRPTYYVDGAPVATDPDATVRSLPLDRLVGVEVYARPGTVPLIFADASENCGLIALWTRR